MRDIITVVQFTMKDMLGRKSFRISTIFILILIVLGFNIPNIINALGADNLNDTILISDQSNLFENQLGALNDADLGYTLDIQPSDYETIKTKLEDGSIDSAVIVEKQADGAKIRYIVKNTALVNGFPQGLLDHLNALYTNIQIHKLGLSDKQIQSLNPNFEFSLEQTEEQTIGGNIFVMMLLSIVLFYAIYFCAYQVSSSITTEKTSKIMETLVTSTSPTAIILGKTIGIGLVGLLQILLFGVTAILCALTFIGTDSLSQVFDLSTFTPYLAIITIIYFLLGYSVYALLYALTGSTVSKPEDIQSANTPVALLSAFGFYLAYFTLTDPTSSLNVFAALFPISSPFCMPIRIMMGLASGWEVALSLAILAVTILIIARVAIRIYSNAMLRYGTKMSLGEILRSYKNK